MFKLENNNQGFILLAALVIVSLSSLAAVASIAASQQMLRFAQLKNALSEQQSTQLSKSVSDFLTIASSKNVLDSSTRQIAIVDNSYQRLYSITAKHRDFALLFDWRSLVELPSTQCQEIETKHRNFFTAAKTCNALSSLSTSVYGNLTLDELEVSLQSFTTETLLVKGDLTIKRLMLSGNNDSSMLQIYALGNIEIQSLIVDNPHSTKLLLYSETSQIKLTSLTTPELVCGVSDTSSNLKITAISPHGLLVNGLAIPAKKTTKCAQVITSTLEQGLIITGS